MDKTIELSRVIAALKRFWWLIVVFSVIGLAVSYFYTHQFMTKTYEAKTQILVKPEKNEQNQNFDVQLNKQLLNTYQVIVTSSTVLDQLKKELHLPLTNPQLAKKITVSNESASQILVIGIQDQDPKEAIRIVNKLANILQTKARDLMGEKNVHILSPAKFENSKVPIGPNVKLYCAIGVIIGAFVAIFIMIAIELLSTTIRTKEDVEALVEVPVLGIINRRKP